MYLSNEINIGSLPLGGNNPVRVQSMTNTDTLDTRSSVAQCIRIIEAGADMVRLATRGIKEAENLANIRKELRKAGFDTPLIADVHFNPKVAEVAARLVEKVRINPGNYSDKRASFSKVDLTEKEYSAELEKIHERLLPLIRVAAENGTSIRIGVNHGSLSDRIMTRYGNTPKGMALSAMEFIRIFDAENFGNLVLSMKSSNSLIMIGATRLLVDMMKQEGFSFPLHLGVTEAGEGEDGRIRSALGIGALLAGGIGDTIRVSLSEPPENEIPVAMSIVKHALLYKGSPVDKRAMVHLKDGVSRLRLSYSEDDPEQLAIRASVDSSVVLTGGEAKDLIIENDGCISKEIVRSVTEGILQAARIRISRNDYISCPTCGRTDFDLLDAVARVKKATSHLKGLKIAIMGCVVNGPGEMADADYGYVGAGKGLVHLYKGKEAVMKNLPEKEAVTKLLEIINKDLNVGAKDLNVGAGL